MMRKQYVLLLLFVTFATNVVAQVKVAAQIDSSEIFIGEQVAVQVEVVHPEGVAVVFPKDLSVLVDKKLELINKGEVKEFSDTPEKGFTTSKFKFSLTSFEPSLYYIPQLSISVGKKSYETNQLALKVKNVEVDTLHVDKFFGPKEIIEPIYTWRDWMPMLFFSLILIVSVVAIAYIVYLMRHVKDVKVLKVKKIFIPPHKEAAKEIENLKLKYNSNELSSKDYYTELISILRKYVTNRYGFSAKEMTSFELVENLMRIDKEEHSNNAKETNERNLQPDLNEIKEILSTADLTKFAKLCTDINEDHMNLMRLSEYIEATKVDMQKPIYEKKEESPIQTKQVKPKLFLKITLILTVIVAVVIVLLLFKEAFDLIL